MITGPRIQRLVIRQTVAPAYLPVTIDEVKAQCRIDEADETEEEVLRGYILAAVAYCESATLRQIMPATWRLTLDRFPGGALNDSSSPAIEGMDILLPRPRIQAVTSIVYVDADGASQTMSAADYIVGTDEAPGRISLAYGASWPTSRAQAGAIVITYTAGYALSSDTEAVQQAAVDQRFKQAIKLLVAHWYENREVVLIGTISGPLAFTVESLLSALQVTEVW